MDVDHVPVAVSSSSSDCNNPAAKLLFEALKQDDKDAINANVRRARHELISYPPVMLGGRPLAFEGAMTYAKMLDLLTDGAAPAPVQHNLQAAVSAGGIHVHKCVIPLADQAKLDTLIRPRKTLDLIASKLASSIANLSNAASSDQTPPEVDTLSADYVALMLCEPYGGLQSCSLAVTKNCAANEIGDFSLMRYMRPQEWESFRLTGTPPVSKNTLCYLCLLKMSNAVAVLIGTKGTHGVGYHPPFYHYVNAPGGYRREAMECSSSSARGSAIFGLVRRFSNDDYRVSNVQMMGPVPDNNTPNKIRMVSLPIRCLKELDSLRCERSPANVRPLASGGCIVPRCEDLLAVDLGPSTPDKELLTELSSDAVCTLTEFAHTVLGDRADNFIDLNKPYGCDIPSHVRVAKSPGTVDTVALRTLLCFCDLIEGRIRLVHALRDSKADRDFSLLTRHRLLPDMLTHYVVPVELQYERTMLGVLSHTILTLVLLRLDEVRRLMATRAPGDDVAHRLRVYHESLMPMLEYFKNAASTGMPLDDVHLFEPRVNSLVPFYTVRPRPPPVYFSAAHVAGLALPSAEARDASNKEKLQSLYSSLSVALDFVDALQLPTSDCTPAWRMRRALFAGPAPWSIAEASCALVSCAERDIYSDEIVAAAAAGAAEHYRTSVEAAAESPAKRDAGAKQVSAVVTEMLCSNSYRAIPWVAFLMRIEVIVQLLRRLAPHAECHAVAAGIYTTSLARALAKCNDDACQRPCSSIDMVQLFGNVQETLRRIDEEAVIVCGLPAGPCAAKAYSLQMPLRLLLACHVRALHDLSVRYAKASSSHGPTARPDTLALACIEGLAMVNVDELAAGPCDVWLPGQGALARFISAGLHEDTLPRTQMPAPHSVMVMLSKCTPEEHVIVDRITNGDKAGVYCMPGEAVSFEDALRHTSESSDRLPVERINRYINNCILRSRGGLYVGLLAIHQVSHSDVVHTMAEACAKINIKIARDASLTRGYPIGAKHLLQPQSVVENVEFFARRLWTLRVPFQWYLLEALGLPRSTAASLRPAMDANKPSVVVRELAIAEPEQYAVAALFFDMLMRYRRRTVYTLDAGLMRRQLHAALHLGELPRRGQPFGVVGSVLCCDRILTITAQVDPEYRGINNVHTSLDTGVMTCKLRPGRPVSSGDPDGKRTCKGADHSIRAYSLLRRSTMPVNSLGKMLRYEALDQKYAEARKRAKAHSTVVCKTLLHLPCGREPLLLPVVGHVVEVKSTSDRVETLTMCPRCCRMTAFSLAMFGPNGFTCGACDTGVRLAVTCSTPDAMEPRCFFCNRTRAEAAERALSLSLLALFTGLVVMGRYDGNKVVYMCSCCFEPWIYHATEFLVAEDIRQLWRFQKRTVCVDAFRVDELSDSMHDKNALEILRQIVAQGSQPRTALYPPKALGFTVGAFSAHDTRALHTEPVAATKQTEQFVAMRRRAKVRIAKQKAAVQKKK